MSNPLDLHDLRARVQAAVDAHVQEQGAVLAEIGEEMTPLLEAVAALLGGGKRLRAAFLYWGYRAGGGPDSDAVVRAATAMEFFQARGPAARRRDGRQRHPPRPSRGAPSPGGRARRAGLDRQRRRASASPVPSSPATCA